jgi:lysophosphatidic acid acyltransferase/lysophosphatidylinositol acyltransferase
MQRARRFLVGIILFPLLFLFLLGINAVQMLSILTLPFSRRVCRRINRQCAQTWWSACALTLEKISGIQLDLDGDSPPPAENAIVICNHQSMADIPVLFLLGIRTRRLGDIKWFVKEELKYVPGVGWGMFFLDCVFVARDWAKDERSVREKFRKYREDQIPIWLLIFPEGTRRTPRKQERAKGFADERGLYAPNHVLVPRTRGFSASAQGLGEHVQSVYDVTIFYPESVPTLRQFILGSHQRVRMHFKRYEIDSMGLSTEALESFLKSRFEEKDQRLENWSRQDSVASANGSPHVTASQN